MYAMRFGYQINELSVMIQNILHRWCSEKIHGIYIYGYNDPSYNLGQPTSLGENLSGYIWYQSGPLPRDVRIL